MRKEKPKLGSKKEKPKSRKPRQGWKKESQLVAKTGDDKLVWPEFGNSGDSDLIW